MTPLNQQFHRIYHSDTGRVYSLQYLQRNNNQVDIASDVQCLWDSNIQLDTELQNSKRLYNFLMLMLQLDESPLNLLYINNHAHTFNKWQCLNQVGKHNHLDKLSKLLLLNSNHKFSLQDKVIDKGKLCQQGKHNQQLLRNLLELLFDHTQELVSLEEIADNQKLICCLLMRCRCQMDNLIHMKHL